MSRMAIRYGRAEMIIQFHRWTFESRDQLPINTLLYTTSVINTPSRVESDIRLAQESLMGVALRLFDVKPPWVFDAIRLRDETKRKEVLNRAGCSPCDRPPVGPTYFQTFERYEARKKAIPDRPRSFWSMKQCILMAPYQVLIQDGHMLDITSDIQSLTTFRRSSAHLMKQLKKTRRPVVLTVDGKAAAVVQDAEVDQRLLNIAASAKAEEGIRQGLDDVAHGRTRPAREFFEEFEAKNGIPRFRLSGACGRQAARSASCYLLTAMS
jgi:PHD/YefM family antitoxin component YafN of YafNO toxin-antitoxin module